MLSSFGVPGSRWSGGWRGSGLASRRTQDLAATAGAQLARAPSDDAAKPGADRADTLPGARRTEWLAQTAEFFATDGDLPRAQRFAATLAGPEKSAAVQAVGGVLLSEDFDAGAQMIAGTGDRAALLSAIRGRFAADGGRVRSWIARTPLLTLEEKARLRAPSPTPASPQ